jgi:hypothetical protein
MSLVRNRVEANSSRMVPHWELAVLTIEYVRLWVPRGATILIANLASVFVVNRWGASSYEVEINSNWHNKNLDGNSSLITTSA